MPQHKDLSGSDLHEPKGVSGASANTVYVASGAGTGSWSLLTPASVNFSTLSVYTGTTLTVTGSATIPWDNTASVSGADLEIVSGNTTRIRALRAGVLWFSYRFCVGSVATAGTYYVRKNGSTILTGTKGSFKASTDSVELQVGVVPMAVNDYVELYVARSSGPLRSTDSAQPYATSSYILF